MKKTIRAGLLVVFFLVFSCALNKGNFASAFPYSTIADCKNAMGSYYNIEDVNSFYCPVGIEDNAYYGGVNQICTAWFGNGSSTTIFVSSLSGTTYAKYYGFCSYGSNVATVNTTNDNNSIQDNLSLTRTAWPNIGSTGDASIDIAKFVSGVSPYSCYGGEYRCYSRSINVGRVRSGTSIIPTHSIDEYFTIAIPVYSLTAYAVDSGGSLLSSSAICAKTAISGGSASCAASSYTGYTFAGWRSNRYSGNPSGSSPYTVSSMTANVTVYAVYNKQKMTLTGKAIDTGGSSLASLMSDLTATVDYNTAASITRRTTTCYDFQGWKNNSTDGWYSGGKDATYSVSNLTSSITRYAVYKIKTMSLVGKAIDTGGNSLSSIIADVSTSANCNSRATITRRTATGYTFRGWKLRTTDGWYSGGTDTSYSVANLTAGATVYAVYERNSFSGQASVAQGKNWSGTSNRAASGWVNTDKSVSINVDCANSGCDSNFWLQLRTDSGTGATNYRIGTSDNGGSTSWWPSSSTSRAITPGGASSPSLVLGTSSNVGDYKQLLPGQSRCRYLAFYPYGSLANNVYKTVSACANAKVTNFRGMSSVSGVASGSTGWTSATTEKVVPISNCSATSGCSVAFKHELEGSNSIGSTDYTVSRTSNLIASTKSIANKADVAHGTFTSTDSTANSKQVSSNSGFTLYPGMVLCEKMTFKPNNNKKTVASDVSTTICASALGNAQPDDPSNPDAAEDPNKDSGDTSFVNIKVRNQSVAKYSNYQRLVYAKPGDLLTYRATYNPVLQYTYYLKPVQMRINGGGVIAGNNNTLGALFNANKGSLRNWNNGFSVQRAYNAGFGNAVLIGDYSDAAGTVTKQSKTNDYNKSIGGVLPSDAGKSIDERAITNLNTTTQTTPSQVKFEPSGDNNVANVLTAAKGEDKIAYARVPYNYNTSVEVTTPETTPIYAGEETKISFNVVIQPKNNSETMNSGDRNYATIVGNPKYKIIVYQGRQQGGGTYGGDNICEGHFRLSNNETSCGYSLEVSGSEAKNAINGSMNTYANTTKSLSRTFNAQDIKAGSQICVAAAFWPASSGVDTSMDADGSHSWRISDSKCYTVAKKPSLQIWGGNIFSAGSINTAVASKTNVAGFTNYSVGTLNSYAYKFGTWGELGIVSTGAVMGTASGAWTGYTRDDNGTLVASPGGSYELKDSTVCVRSVLTFANYVCGEGNKKLYPGNLSGGAIATSNASRDKSAIIANFAIGTRRDGGTSKSNNRVSGEVVLNNSEMVNERGAYYYYGENDNLTIPKTKIQAGTTQLVEANKSVQISGNLEYAGNYAAIEDVPKLVIYARGNIYINCNVTRIDAMLIAEGAVVTCGDFSTDLTKIGDAANINKQENSTPLTVNGTIITGRLIANRTYGAATGANSITPAETINYDSTLYMWGSRTADVSTSGKLSTAYTKELSPRY